MLKREIKYLDPFTEEETTGTFYFNLTKIEWTELEVTYPGGFLESLQKYAANDDQGKIFLMIKEFLLSSYGVRDGNDFVKTPDLRTRFQSSEAYSVLFEELAQDDKKAWDFMRGVMPKEMTANIPTEQPMPPKTIVIPPLAPPAAT